MSDWTQLWQLGVKLEAAPARARQIAATAVAKTALDVERIAKTLCPVDTGATRSSITARRTGDLSWEIGPTTHYAPWLEYGTSRMAARPFMAPAAEFAMPGLERALANIAGGLL